MTTGWQPLSVRRGLRDSDGPFEGMPLHLRHPVGEWLRTRFGWTSRDGMNNSLMAQVASACRIPVRRTYETGGISDQIFAAIERNEDLYLDCLDVTLYLARQGGDALARTLTTGGSVWTVRPDAQGLERRVPEATAEAYASAIAAADPVAEELKEAWAATYGRSGDPSDAWDHAIKAVEDLLIPIVVPKIPKANLGTVAGEIKANSTRWNLGLPENGGRTNGDVLEGMLRLIWPNPDRHGGAAKRAPTSDESEAAVLTAIAIVGLCRNRLEKAP